MIEIKIVGAQGSGKSRLARAIHVVAHAMGISVGVWSSSNGEYFTNEVNFGATPRPLTREERHAQCVVGTRICPECEHGLLRYKVYVDLWRCDYCDSTAKGTPVRETTIEGASNVPTVRK